MPTIFETLDSLSKGIETLHAQLAPLQNIFGPHGFLLEAPTVRRRGRRRAARKAVVRRGPGPGPARRKISAATRANLKLAGKYMGLTRNLSAAQKAQVKNVREKKGYAEAIKFAASLKRRD
jgi:hypothetical protein